jgi:kynurenine formamidase
MKNDAEMNRRAPLASEMLEYFDTLSNWGRWGEDDQAGTLNYITADSVRAATALVRDGVHVSCSAVIKAETEPDQILGPPQRYMVSTGDSAHPGDSPDRAGWGPIEYIGLTFHGFTVTHIDALCHNVWQGKMYNGKPASMVTTRSGALVESVLAARSGIVTRGVVLDIAAVRGKRWLDPGEGVYPEDLELAEERQGVRVGEGDAVLIRTGYDLRRREFGQDAKLVGQPGWHVASLPWLHERRVAVIGSDSCQEVVPSGYDELVHPVHKIGIVAMGLWLIDNMQLEQVVQLCVARNRWQFCLTVAPLLIDGGTGSPVNPIALF